MASILTLHALLIDEIRDFFYAEHHLIKALLKMDETLRASEGDL